MNQLLKSSASRAIWLLAGSRLLRRRIRHLGLRIDRKWYSPEMGKPVYLCGRKFTMSHLGNELTCRSFWRENYYEPLSMWAIASLADRIEAMVDVGSNVGLFSLFAAKAPNPPHILAFEPNPEVRQVLEHNCGLNGGGIETSALALSDKDGTASLHLPPSETSGALDADFNPVVTDHVEVKTATMDSAVLANPAIASCKPGRILVKMDILGHESAVLRGGREFTTQMRPIYLLEMIRDYDPEEIAFLKQSGYRFHLLLPGGTREIETPEGIGEGRYYFGNFIATTEPGDVEAIDRAIANISSEGLEESSYYGFNGRDSTDEQ